MREATRDDLDDILQLERQTFPDTAFSRSTFLYYMSSRSSRVYLLELDNELAGYVVFTLRGSPCSVYVDSIAVKPEHRRQGLGRRMMDKVVAAARRHGAERVHLHVRTSNRCALEFYRSLGFGETDTAEDYYRNGEDARVMERDITA